MTRETARCDPRSFALRSCHRSSPRPAMRSGHAWTDAEDEQLLKLYVRTDATTNWGRAVEIGLTLGRTPQGVMSRYASVMNMKRHAKEAFEGMTGPQRCYILHYYVERGKAPPKSTEAMFLNNGFIGLNRKLTSFGKAVVKEVLADGPGLRAVDLYGPLESEG